MTRAGFDDENPGESAMTKWEALAFPDSIRYFEDLNDWLMTVTDHYNRLVQMGQHEPGRWLDENKLLSDLSRKVLKGNDFRTWFYGHYHVHELNSFRDWIMRARAYLPLLPPRKGKAAKVLNTQEVVGGRPASPGGGSDGRAAA